MARTRAYVKTTKDPHQITIECVRVHDGEAHLVLTSNGEKGPLTPNVDPDMRTEVLIPGHEFTIVIEDSGDGGDPGWE